MRCIVQNCTTFSKKSAKSLGIAFHSFPTNDKDRDSWAAALGIDHWTLNKKSVVCSIHFREDDIYFTKHGEQKIFSGAVPVLDQDSDQDLDSPASVVCRICLSNNTKFYDIWEHGLMQMYERLIGTCLTPDDKLPQKLCWECAHRLSSSWRLRNRALRAQELLLGVFVAGEGHYITLRDIKSIDRRQLNLKSTLISKVNGQDDLNVQLNDVIEFVKTEQDYNQCHDTCHDIEDGREEMKEYIGNKIETTEDSRLAPPTELLKDESSNGATSMFVEELSGHFESDDDMALSEVVSENQLKKPKKREKKSRKKLKDHKPVKMKKIKIGINKSESKDEESEDPVTATEKFKNSDVKRRRTQDALDESLFNISVLTYEEQIAEVRERQETSAYMNAPYKCTVCFRGFMIMDRYMAHSVRHTDACGAFECFICFTRLKSSRALRKHLTAQHTEKFSCKGCPFTTRNRGVAREHEKWHAGTKYQCPHCPSEFDKITTYMGHIRIKHASDFVCDLCGYTFVSSKGVEVHKKKKHRLDCEIPLDGPFCEVCDVKFINQEAYDRHMKLSSRHSHENDPNRIRNDSQSMNSNGRVTRKVERRPNIHPKDGSEKDRPPPGGPVTCEQCGIQLRDLRLYAQHFRRAHPDKNRTKYPAMKTPCMCELCGRLFQSMALLKDHMWVHTGEKRFKCHQCDKSFTQKTNLVFHARAHTNARPTYPCALCGKQFAFHNNRRRHMFIHTGLKPFKCDTCGKSFTTSGEQRAHIEHVHMKKPWPKRARQRPTAGPNEWDKCGTQDED